MKKLTNLIIWALLPVGSLAVLASCGGGGLEVVHTGSGSSGSSFPRLAAWNDSFPAARAVSNCYTDPAVNMCVIYKNPVYARGLSFSPTLTPQTSSNTLENQFITLGLNVPKTGPLSNAHFRIDDAVKAVPMSGNWKYRYYGDNNGYVSQVQTFYWANRQLAYMKERTGKFYFENKNALLVAYDSTVEDNAYFNGTGIVLGYRSTAQGRLHVGLDASVTAHEIGHGNLYVASNQAAVNGCSEIGCFCATKNGCFGAIHEGQGDVHAFILFPENSAIGEHFMNNGDGLRKAAAVKTGNVTAQNRFDANNGEIHDMGEIYASIWWEVWAQAKAQGQEKDIEVIFTNHLAGLGSGDTFTTALDVITTMAQQAYPDKAASIVNNFRTEYTRVGVTIP